MIALLLGKRTIPFIISLAMFMESVDATILNTAIPVMAKELNVNPLDLKIALISYLLSLALFIPISGWIADKFGIKRVFMSALILFTISSFFCGRATNLYELVFMRIIQGLGGSLMLPLGRLIVVRMYKKNELVNIMNQVVLIGSFGIMLGPVLGGVITTNFSWRWIFYVNIPVGLFNILITYYYLPTIKSLPTKPLDKIGFIFFGTALASLTFGLSALSESAIEKSTSIAIIFFAILLFIFYILHSRQQDNPIINTKLFDYRTFKVSVFGNLISRLGFGGLSFIIPLLLQIGLGYTSQLSGFLLAPIAMGILMMKSFSLQILRWLNYRKLLLGNTILLGMSVMSFSLVNNNTSLVLIACFTFLFGIISALQYTCLNSIAYAQIEDEHYSSATSIMSALQQVGQSFGVAISALLIEIFAVSNQVISIKDLHHTFIAMSLITMCSLFVFLQLKEDDGKEMIEK